MRNHTIAADQDFLLRLGVQEAGGAAGASTDDWQLQYRKNGGTWTSVTASSSNVQAFTTSGLTDGGTTTNRLTAGTGSFVAGEQEEADGEVEDRQLTASNFTEHLFALSLVEADLSSGDRLEFRLLLNTVAITSNITPIMMVSTGPILRGVVTGFSGSFNNEFTANFSSLGIQSGDLLVAVGGIDADDSTAGFDTPSGYTKELEEENQTIITVAEYKPSASGSETTQQFTASGITTQDDSWFAMRIDGHDSSDPIGASASTNGDSSAPSSPTVTPGRTNNLLLALVGFDGADNGEPAAPMGSQTYINLGRSHVGSTSDTEYDGFAAFSVRTAASATGAATWSTATSDGWHGFHIAIQAATTGFTLDAAGGSYAQSGTAANLEYHSVLGAAAGSFSISGQAASLEYHTVIIAEADFCSLSGQDAGFVFDSLIPAEAVAYSVAGAEANLEYHQLFAAAAGGYSVSGKDATLVYSIVLPADAGSYSWSGEDANLEFHGVLSTEAGPYAWSGQDATLTYTPLGNFSLGADAGSHGWTGVDASLLLDAVLAAQAGAYSWTGTDVALTFSGATGSPIPRYVGLTHSVGKLINN